MNDMTEKGKDNDNTYFGFQKIGWNEKQDKVNKVFESVSPKYDLMNDLMSFGMHRFWKKIAVRATKSKKNDVVLDLAGGTGDITFYLSKIVGDNGRIILSDINEKMLTLGREKLINQGLLRNITYVQANAEMLPFKANFFDSVIISFGLRNVTEKDKALSQIYRVIKPGGKLVILEFSKLTVPAWNRLYDLYSFNFLPFLGESIAKDKHSYQYLVESIRKHPDQETLKGMMYTAGFDKVFYRNLSLGIVAIHTGYKY